MNDTLQTAIQWFKIGLSCIPAYPNSKMLLRGTRINGYQATLPELVQNFNNTANNIALIPGQAGNGLCLVVLDFDSVVNFCEWRKKYQVETYQVQTVRGFHNYFWSEHEPIGQVVIGAELKYQQPVMIPPSVVNGHRYIGNDKEIMRISNLEEIGVVSSPQSKGKEARISITINGNNNVVNLNASSFTLRSGILDRVKNALPILDYLADFEPVKSSDDGRFYLAFCPAHDDSNRSLSIDVLNDLVSCFRSDCRLHSRRGFDVVGVHSVLTGLSAGQAAKNLANKLGF